MKTVAADPEEEQRLKELLAKVAFDVEMHGLAASSDAPAHEIYHPKLRKSDVTRQGALASNIYGSHCGSD